MVTARDSEGYVFLVDDTAFARVSTTTGAVTVAADADITFIRPTTSP